MFVILDTLTDRCLATDNGTPVLRSYKTNGMLMFYSKTDAEQYYKWWKSVLKSRCCIVHVNDVESNICLF